MSAALSRHRTMPIRFASRYRAGMHLRLTAIAATALLAAGCSSTPEPATTTAPVNAPAPAVSTVPDRMICKVTGGGGSYYLLLTSAENHNFSLCDGATPYPHTVDDLLGAKGMDRRCILPDSYIAANGVLVAVYSGSRKPDLAAARAFCETNGGSQ